MTFGPLEAKEAGLNQTAHDFGPSSVCLKQTVRDFGPELAKNIEFYRTFVVF